MRKKKNRRRDPNRRAIVLRLVKATGLSEVQVYRLLSSGGRPTSRLAAEAWDRALAPESAEGGAS